MRTALHSALLTCLVFLSLTAHAQDSDQKREFAKCWERKAGADVSVPSASDASNIYFVDLERRLIAVELRTGATVWSTELGGAAVSNLLVTNDSVIVASTGAETASGVDSVLRSVSKQTGITGWFVKMPSAQSLDIGAVNGTVVVVGRSGSVTAFATSTGEARWSKSIGATFTTDPFFVAATMYAGTERNEVVAIAAATGDLTVVAKTGSAPTVLFSDQSGRVLVGDDRGNLTLMTAEGKRIWRFRNGARISSISQYDSEFLAASNDNFVYKLSKGGNVEWKRRLSSRIDGRPLVVDDIAVFSTVGDGSVYVVDLTNGKIINRFENGENNPAQAVSAGHEFVVVTRDELTRFSRGGCTSK